MNVLICMNLLIPGSFILVISTQHCPVFEREKHCPASAWIDSSGEGTSFCMNVFEIKAIGASYLFMLSLV
jgi:hypothetical protein